MLQALNKKGKLAVQYKQLIKPQIILIIFVLNYCLNDFIAFSQVLELSSNDSYEAIVIGEMVDKDVKKRKNYYFTEYKLKTSEWLFKKAEVKKSKYVKIKILGADLPKKGIIIKLSTAPDYVPMKKPAIFLLERTKKHEKNVFTLSEGGIILDLKEKSEIIKKKEI